MQKSFTIWTIYNKEAPQMKEEPTYEQLMAMTTLELYAWAEECLREALKEGTFHSELCSVLDTIGDINYDRGYDEAEYDLEDD